ncbi:hypothetical protein [Salipiger bermudensis]|uniref:hypothetical protein n=1 Tax=Salipiger bermudensis TaxID=344736 RepID=UPI001CD3F69E|nr:hypothetical protein [Salipiger bermudensis]MCA0964994.1 hypothetical protein [Salipiger bermudensis]
MYLIANAIIAEMSPESQKVTSLAKTGAEIVEFERVNKIELITVDKKTTIMDGSSARVILRRTDSHILRHSSAEAISKPSEIERMARDAIESGIPGKVLEIDSALHFRPAGYRYVTPIEWSKYWIEQELHPGERYRINGEIHLKDGMPDYVAIRSVSQP